MNSLNATSSVGGGLNADPQGIWRTLKYDLAEQEITVVRSPHDFSKQTHGAAEGVSYLLDDRGIIDSIKCTCAIVREKVIELGVPIDDVIPDPQIRHKAATIDVAKSGANEIEDAVHRQSKVLVGRGAHDAADLSGLLRATNGNVGIVIVDTHADIHTPSTSISGNPHGMWVSVLLGDGEGLDAIMENTPLLKPENIIYIGPTQLEKAEVERLTAKGIKVFTGYNLHSEKIMNAIDELQARVPVWLDIDEDGMINAAATMPGGMVSPELLKAVANRMGTNEKIVDMHPVLGVAFSEFQAPNADNPVEVARAEFHAEVLKATIHQAIGAGYHEPSCDIAL